MSEWQPIETAPKDGSRVIVWSPSFIGPITAQFYAGVGYENRGKFGITYEMLLGHEPTHWQPLPEPPKDNA